MGINTISLYDGMSCGHLALDRANIECDNYFASEIKPHAIKLTQHHYPNTIQLGDVRNVHYTNLGIEVDKSDSSMRVLGYGIDLLVGGSPCQDITRLKPGKGVNDEKSKLFYEYVRIYHQIAKVNPKVKFLLENVVGDKESIEIISDIMEVKPIRINSNLVSYQNRDRYYWTNIEGVTIPDDLKISFQDYKEIDYEVELKYKVNNTPSRRTMWGEGKNGKCPNVSYREKINCLTCKQDRWSNSGLVELDDFCRYLTRQELEQAQTVPVGYTDILSYNQASDLLGDGWTIDVIAHILSFLKPSAGA